MLPAKKLVAEIVEDVVDLGNGISLDLISLEEQFANLKIRPIIVNDVADEFSVGKTVDVINDLIRTHFDEDELNTVPSCDHGCTVGGFNLGETCHECGTEVVRSIERPLESQLWMRVPDQVTAFVHPRFWRHFEVTFSTSSFSLIEYLTNPTYKVPVINGKRGGNKHIERVLDILAEEKIERGINFFCRHFDRIMDVILEPKRFLMYRFNNPAQRVREAIRFRAYINEFRDCIFTRYLPFPSKLIMVSERGGTMSFIDKTMTDAFDAPKTIASIENSPFRLSDKVVQSRVVKTIKLMSSYYQNYYTVTCSKKSGMFRRQLGSTRSPFTGRAVIAPLPYGHAYDEVHSPWAWTVTLLRVHILNKLLRLEYMTPPRAFRLIDEATVKYNRLIHDIINELIDECPEGGIPIAMLRNPTLERLSDQYFRITKVLTDVNENAILISNLVIKGSNADYDGDQLQVKLLLGADEKRRFERLRSHLGLMDTDRAFRVKGIATLFPEVATMANNFLNHYRRSRRNG
jgi:hypothetical protein